MIVSERFGMSARQAENGFKRKRIVSSRRLGRNIRARNGSNFNARKIDWGGGAVPDLAPPAGRGRIRAMARIRVRGIHRTRYISAFAGRALTPTFSPQARGEEVDCGSLRCGARPSRRPARTDIRHL